MRNRLMGRLSMAGRVAATCTLLLTTRSRVTAGAVAGDASPALADAPSPIVFAPAARFTTSSSPVSLVAADFNGDSKDDLGGSTGGSATVTVRLSQGNGLFTVAGSVTFSANPWGLAAADFDGDGHQDLAAALNSLSAIGVAFGNGDGTFDAPVNYGTVIRPIIVKVGDFDGDGRPDLMAGNWDFGQSVLMNLGSGALGAPHVIYDDTGISLFNSATDYAVEDFDGDGLDDIVVAGFQQFDFECGGTGFVYYKSTGSGSFSSSHVDGQQCPWLIAASDWDRDGLIDVLINGLSLYPDWNVHRDLGGGAFVPGVLSPLALPGATDAILAADFNGDAIPDLALPQSEQPVVILKAGIGDGTLDADRPLALAGNHGPMVSGDFDNDSQPDLAVIEWGVNSVAVFLNRSVVVAPPGTIGEASGDYTAPLLVGGYNAATGDIGVSYGPACGATGHSIVYGNLLPPNRGAYLGQACGLGTSGMAVFNPGSGSVFFYVVGDNGTREGSYGRDSLGAERAPFAGGACDLPQDLSSTCP